MVVRRLIPLGKPPRSSLKYLNESLREMGVICGVGWQLLFGWVRQVGHSLFCYFEMGLRLRSLEVELHEEFLVPLFERSVID